VGAGRAREVPLGVSLSETQIAHYEAGRFTVPAAVLLAALEITYKPKRRPRKLGQRPPHP